VAGEWIAVDVGLPDKPEVQELIDVTGEPVEVVVYRLYRLWSWAAMNCTDGTARMTVARLVRTCGANEDFWNAVAGVGWLEIDETVASVAVPGWDRRFSQAAKSRAQHADRGREYEERNPARRTRAGRAGAHAPDDPTPERGRGDRRDREEVHHHHPREAWEQFRQAWNAGQGRKWTPSTPPDGWEDRLGEPGWLEVATEAIGRLGDCRYFKTPMTLIQFLKPGWAHKVLGGSFDNPKGTPQRGKDFGDKPQPTQWTPDELLALERARRKVTQSKEAL
jgi:hypothetical protein